MKAVVSVKVLSKNLFVGPILRSLLAIAMAKAGLR
jgi:hypothetical protein